jgi:G3E family GTPase
VVDSCYGHDAGHGHGVAVKAKRKIHDLSKVGSVGVLLEGDLDNIKFNYFMGALLREKASDLYRSKGVLSIHDQGDTKFVFQGVHESINFGPAVSKWEEGEKRVRGPFSLAVIIAQSRTRCTSRYAVSGQQDGIHW